MYRITPSQLNVALRQHRPFIRLNMIQTINSVIHKAGSSWAIGGEADHLAFREIRSHADTIMVGGETVRSEDIPFPRSHGGSTDPQTVEAPALIVVSPSFSLPASLRIFADPANYPRLTVVTTREGLARSTDSQALWDRLVAGGMQPFVSEGPIVWTEVMEFLRTVRDCKSLLCEGGPTLNGLLLNANLVDEICMTLSLGLVVPNLTPSGIPETPSIAVGLLRDVSTDLIDSAHSNHEVLVRLAVRHR